MRESTQRVAITMSIVVATHLFGYGLCGLAYIPFLVISSVAFVAVSQSHGRTAGRALAHTGCFILPTLFTGGFFIAFICYAIICGSAYLIRK